MALNIKNEETQRLSRELAGLTGETVTTAVTIALKERLDRLRGDRDTPEHRAERMLRLGRQIASAMPAHHMRPDELYDEKGLPR